MVNVYDHKLKLQEEINLGHVSKKLCNLEIRLVNKIYIYTYIFLDILKQKLNWQKREEIKKFVPINEHHQF